MEFDPATLAAPPAPPGLRPRDRAPEFSVVIAAYQAADCIGEAITSALGQTVPALEIIVSDDGSTDGLDDALAPFGDRITVLHNPHGGEAAAKNAGLRAARGEYVALLDADDIYLPDRLAMLGELARRRPDLDLLTTDAYVVANGVTVRRVYGTAWTFAAQAQRRTILQRNFILGHVAARRSLLLDAGGFDEHITRTTDWECWIRLILDGASAGAILEPVSEYRLRQSSLSAQRSLMHAGALQTLETARRHPRLSADERTVLETTIKQRRRELAREGLSEAVRSPVGLRTRALQIAVGPHTPATTRLKAALAALAPGLVVRVARRRSGPGWIGAGGTRVH